VNTLRRIFWQNGHSSIWKKTKIPAFLASIGGAGQNAINQAKEFNKAVKLSGISITKLDGTAKGGIVFAIADELKLPIRYIGVGEGIDDLKPFVTKDFVDAIFD
jgi:fused signal recognition particle receptor